MTDQEIRKLAVKELIKKHGRESLLLWATTPNKDVLNLMVEMYKEGERATQKEISSGGWVHRFNSEEDFLNYVKQAKRSVGIIANLLAEPYGCPMCDSGKLRTPDRPHFDDCPYFLANQFLNSEQEQERRVSNTPNQGITSLANKNLLPQLSDKEIEQELIFLYEQYWISIDGADPTFQAQEFGIRIGEFIENELLNRAATTQPDVEQDKKGREY